MVDIPEKSSNLRVLMLGDIVGRPGRKALEVGVRTARQKLAVDLVVANGENAAGGAGIDPGTALEIQKSGVDIVTLGDHAFQRKGSKDLLATHSAWCIRPFNFPTASTPGKGWTSWRRSDGVVVVVANLIGRVFISGTAECPFQGLNRILEETKELKPSVYICDFHAEATSEKWAMARYADGRISLLAGTHTHVQTADAQILPGGTGYITDLGMSGSSSGVIGMDSKVALKRFTSPMPAPYEIAEGEGALAGVVADIDTASGRCVWIEAFRGFRAEIRVAGRVQV